MLIVILTSVGLTLLAVFLLGLFVWWLTGLCIRYDANEGDPFKLWRNPKTGRLVIPADEIVWSEDGT